MSKIEILLIGIILILILNIIYRFFLAFQRKKYLQKQKFTVLAVQVSKENELGPIVAEQIFSTLHSLQYKISFFDKLKGAAPDRISFEIANINRCIKFYIWLPKQLKNLVEGQIYAQYTDAEILEVNDYCEQKRNLEIHEPEIAKNLSNDSHALIKTNKNTPKKSQLPFRPYNSLDNAIGAEMRLEDPEIYPIKRYPQFEDKLTRVAVDPIAGITAALSKLNATGEEAWMQIIVQPLEKKWKNVFVTCLRILNKGIYLKIEKLQKLYVHAYCTRNKLIRTIFFPLYIFFWFQGLTSGSSKSMSLIQEDKNSTENELMEEMSRSHERETDISAALDKVVKLLYKTTIRLVYLPQEKNTRNAELKIKEMAASFCQFNVPHLNGFEIQKIIHGRKIIHDYQNRRLNKKNFVLNNEELATIYHLPNKIVSTPNIYWIRSKKLEPPSDLPTETNCNEVVTTLGKTNFRGSHEEFCIKPSDRRRHVYIIGKTGMGKSTLLENMIYSDIQRGKGVAVIDPHGDLAEAVLSFVPSHRTNDVIVFDPSDRSFPVAFNMLENIDPAHNTIVCSGLVGIFKKIYAESWGPRLEHFLRNTILALLEYPSTTMLGITRMLQDQNFRRKVVNHLTDPIVKAFWTQEFEKMQDRQRIEAISPILNKVGQFLSSPIIRNIVGQPKSAIDLRFAMDKGKIVIVNLSKGKIGEDNSSLLGAMLITKFQLDAMSRADILEKDRKDFYLYVDEFQNFATDSFATILSEARKYRLCLTMANQYISQMSDEVREAVFGNVGTIISFQVGPTDAESLSIQFGEEIVTINDLVNLNKYTAYIKLLVDGMPTPSFSMATLPPPKLADDENNRERIFKVSREKYAKTVESVEDKIKRWSEGGNLLEDKPRKFLPEGKNHFNPPKPNVSAPTNNQVSPVKPAKTDQLKSTTGEKKEQINQNQKPKTSPIPPKIKTKASEITSCKT